MSGSAWEVLDLVARWIHVIAAIMWVGNSMLFNWLDRTLETPSRPGDGLIGESWLLHSGAFYYIEKTALAGQPVPRVLHWFKWQAYITWLSGIALLVVVYYAGGRAALADPEVSSLSHGAAVAVGLGAVFGGVAVYELVQRLVAPRAPRAATAVLFSGFVLSVYALTHLLNGRAAFLHVGAMLASIMAGNVAMTIIPSQRELVKSVQTGGRADPVVSARAKRVSIFNNYITFPVIALMLASHFPSLYSNRWSWLLLLVVVAAGATVRHVLNTRFTTPSWKPRLAATLGASTVALYALMTLAPAAQPSASIAPAGDGLPATVTFADARHVIDRRCGVCHSAVPSDTTFGPAPAGIAFDTPAQIRLHAGRIRERAVVTRTMPPANKTRITDQERLILGRWVDDGAHVP